MKTFQFLLQCVFSGPDAENTKRCGFFATFNVQAGSLKAATGRLPSALANRMTSHHLTHVSTGAFRARCRIVEIWELAEDDDASFSNGDTGFSFFRIGPLWLPLLLLRFAYEERARKHMMISLN